MDLEALSQKMQKQKFSRNKDVMAAKRIKSHPALAQAKAIYTKRTGGKRSS